MNSILEGIVVTDRRASLSSAAVVRSTDQHSSGTDTVTSVNAGRGLPEGLRAAVISVLACELPDSPPARRSDIDLVLGARHLDRGAWGAQSTASYESALIRALMLSGFAREAVALAERETLEVLRRVAGQAPSATESVCYSVMSQAFALNGRLNESADFARIALDYADEADDDAGRCHAVRQLSLAFALNGQFEEAGGELASAMTLSNRHGWTDDDWATTLVRLLIASRSGDAPQLQTVLDSFAGEGREKRLRHALHRFIYRYGKALRFMLLEDYERATVELQAVTHGVDRRSIPPFLVDMALAMKAINLLHCGDPVGAMKTISDRKSPSAHAVCFEMIRATIHLHLSEPREALHVSGTCVKDVPDHSLRTLPSVLLRRAVAFEMLGHTDAADKEFSRASHLAHQLAGTAPALGLPLPILERLFLRLLANEPEFGRTLVERLPLDASYPAAQMPVAGPAALTHRERVLAEWLVAGLTLPQIAQELHVSINTLKTQGRSLYKKLDVSSRSEAIQVLERMPQIVAAAAQLRG